MADSVEAHGIALAAFAAADCATHGPAVFAAFQYMVQPGSSASRLVGDGEQPVPAIPDAGTGRHADRSAAAVRAVTIRPAIAAERPSHFDWTLADAAAGREPRLSSQRFLDGG
jgi:hypothetical protein